LVVGLWQGERRFVAAGCGGEHRVDDDRHAAAQRQQRRGHGGDGGGAAQQADLHRVDLTVVEPVLAATAGGYEAPLAVAQAYHERLLPLATLLVPNVAEAAAVYGGDPAVAFAAGCAAVLLKGGHGDGEFADDVLHLADLQRDAAAGTHRFRRARLPVGPVHGTGCALASAIGCGLAFGLDLPTACGRAGDWLHTLLAALAEVPGDGLPRPLPFWRAAVTRTSNR
jgi:hydroxymethylpyrimidine/phosphomethylpyrimidine kinase